jgi:hypothetical protein
MRMWEISPRVNSPKNDDPSLWEPLHAQTQTTTDALELLLRVGRSLSIGSHNPLKEPVWSWEPLLHIYTNLCDCAITWLNSNKGTKTLTGFFATFYARRAFGILRFPKLAHVFSANFGGIIPSVSCKRLPRQIHDLNAVPPTN